MKKRDSLCSNRVVLLECTDLLFVVGSTVQFSVLAEA